MARKPRRFKANSIFHVYCRVARDEPVFEDSSLADYWLATLAEVAELFDLRVLGYCLLPDSYHLVVRSADLPLWRPMASLQGKVAKRHNRRHGVLGSLWQGRYKARRVAEGEQCCQLLAWVHLQPVATGLVSSAADHTRSGHHVLSQEGPKQGGEPVDEAAAFVAIGELASARYQRKVGVWSDARLPRLRELPWWRGPEGEESGELVSKRPLIELQFAVSWFEGLRSLPERWLTGRSQGRAICRERQLLTMLMVGLSGYPACELSRLLGRSQGTLSRWLDQANRRRSLDETFQAELKVLREAFRKLDAPTEH